MNNNKGKNDIVVIRGGGDIASGIAHRLFVSGFRVIILEIPKPTHIRRSVAFAQAVYDGDITIEGVTACLAADIETAFECLADFKLPVLTDPEGRSIAALKPDVIVDAILAKKNLGTDRSMAKSVIGVGPGFIAGSDVHAVVETNRGHFLGKVILDGPAQADTGIPGTIAGVNEMRILRAGAEGVFEPLKNIGDEAIPDEPVAMIGNTAVTAGISGVVRGMLNPGIEVYPGYKVGDIDPRGDASYCDYVSDKARAVGGGVLEAILRLRITG